MLPYHHSQTGWVLILSLLTAVAGVMLLLASRPSFALVLAGFLGVLLLLFHSMTVRVDPEQVQVWFGAGLIRRRIPLRRIRSHRIARNAWYYGWGIHFFPGGVLYNVSGMSSVELVLDNGRLFRIGTDEPETLASALSHASGHR